MERIDTHGKRAMAKAALLVLALTLAAVVAIYAYPERLTAEASSPPSAAEATPSAPEDEGLWLTVPKMARVRDLPVLSGPASDETALSESALRVAGTGLPWQE